MRARPRVEQDARRVERAGAEHDDRRLEVHHLARVRVDDAHAGGAVRRLADEHFRDDRVRPHRHVAAVARRIDERRRRVERRLDVAAAAAAAAPGAARAVLVVQDAVGRDAGAARNVVAPHLRDRALERHLDAIQLRRPLEHAVRHLRRALRSCPEHPSSTIDLVVVRLHVVVRDRPVDVEAVAAGGVELQRPVAQRAAAPEVRLAAEDARAHPRVRRAGRRVLPLVHDPVAREPVARVRHHLLVLRERGIGCRTGDRESCTRRRRSGARRAAAGCAASTRTATPSSCTRCARRSSGRLRAAAP